LGKNKQDNDDLRRKAEAQAPPYEEDLGAMTADDIMKLVHELRVHQIELEMQNDELRAAQEKIEKSRAEYVDLYDFAPVGYLTLDEKGIILKANLTSASMLETDRGALTNKPFSIFVSNGSSYAFFTFMKKIFEEQTPCLCEIQVKNGKNEEFFVRLDSGFAIDNGGSSNQCKLSMIDITERKRGEEKLKKLLDDREILLKEVHHRVKNNFQTIISLLGLQEDIISDTSVANVFSSIRSRVNAMSLVHEKLYRSEDVSLINLSEYINTMAGDLSRSFKRPNTDINFEIDVLADLTIHLDRAIPLGLILNEVITNSLKHAFPAGTRETGIVSISARVINPNSIEMVLGDNGIGMPDYVDVSSGKTLGMKLIRLLVEHQLGGKLEIVKDGGVKYVISFPASLKSGGQ
jgi:PAS domain S-box-containing protein